MLVSMLTGIFFWMEIDVPRKRRDLGRKHRRHTGGARRTCSVSLGEMSYEVKAEELLKITFDNENGYIIVEVITAKICGAVIDIGHEFLGGQ